MQPLLQVRDLAVAYCSDDRRPIAAVDDVNFDISAGEAVGLLGESGCGKTTLGLTLLGLLPRTGRAPRGSVIFKGTNLLAWEERELQAIRGVAISIVYPKPASATN